MMELDRQREVRGDAIATRDGRNVDAAIGALSGEAALVEVKHPDEAFPVQPETLARAHEAAGTYYGLPVLKEPVWKAWIPLYFYTGGVAGAAAVLGAAAQIVAPRTLRGLVARSRWLATGGLAASALLLIADLGRPARFVNMLRVFRPSSPMNVGTWVVSGAVVASGLAALGSEGAGLVAGALGLPLSGYTAVLLSNTAVPAWLHARRTLPALFMASAVASGAAALEMLPATPGEERCVSAYGVLGKLAELVGMRLVERDLRRHPRVAASLETGGAGRTWRAARVLSVAGLVATLLPVPRRWAGLLSTAGAIALRFAVVQAGRQSARDPLATFAPDA